MVGVIKEEVSLEDNEFPSQPFSLEEVRNATFMLHTNKAPGLDGLMVEFF